MPRSVGFLLAGGGALLASGLGTRVTEDLDFFGSPDTPPVPEVVAEFVVAVAARGWRVTTVQSSATFARLLVEDGARRTLVDVAVDTPPRRQQVWTPAGPTFEPSELAGRKLLALYDRAEARDFVDVFHLSRRFGRDVLIARAAEIELGFDVHVLAQMFGGLARFHEVDLPIESERVSEMRAFFADWAAELR